MSSSGPPAADHPRSRGVYLNQSMTSWTAVGSSPLARGLLRAALAARAARRIIPARAGFTDRAGYRPGNSQDHPRSRGVYPLTHGVVSCPAGSSPLARGLLPLLLLRSVLPRIIPARAGFTSRTPPPRPRGRDHPRSRGVYVFRASVASEFEGSSPLARGLRARRARPRHRGGIIPARAGFTRKPSCSPTT